MRKSVDADLVRTHPGREPNKPCKVDLNRSYRNSGPKRVGRQIHHGNKRKPPIYIFRCMMSDHVSADQIPKGTANKKV
jgi:hypothetical protein